MEYCKIACYEVRCKYCFAWEISFLMLELYVSINVDFFLIIVGEKELAGFLLEKSSLKTDTGASFAEPSASQAMDTDMAEAGKAGNTKSKDATKVRFIC